jgi:capsular exopolysaccharide synthesis family protein
VRVIDEAQEPSGPYKPNAPLNLAAGFVLGLALGLVAAALREWSDRSLKTPAEVETIIGVTCLGLLPEIARNKRRRSREVVLGALNDRDLVVARHPEGGVAEAARAIRTNLTFMSPDRPYRSILVTSAIPEEGKTTVACSLSTVLVQSGLRVLIVDTDLRRPRLHRTFKLPNDLGVTMAISNQAPIDECIRESSIRNLWVLTSGPLPPNPAELLQSDRFAALARELYSKFDRVVFDSPPILPVTDAAILSRLVDGVVVVARAFSTQKSAARQAVKQLLDVKAHVIGVVLNAVDLGRHDYREYHYYYKRDGYYSSPEAPRLVDPPADGASASPPQ